MQIIQTLKNINKRKQALEHRYLLYDLIRSIDMSTRSDERSERTCFSFSCSEMNRAPSKLNKENWSALQLKEGRKEGIAKSVNCTKYLCLLKSTQMRKIEKLNKNKNKSDTRAEYWLLDLIHSIDIGSRGNERSENINFSLFCS